MSSRAIRVLACAAVVTVPALIAGCGTVQPWVKPYERERLADPVMQWDRAAVSSAYMGHVRENREGARGASGGAGGGCGCN